MALKLKLLFAVAALASFPAVANADGNSSGGPIIATPASPARPFNLPMNVDIYKFASDARSADFYTNVMPEFLTIINDQLSESVEFVGRNGFKLDASKLLLRTESDLPIRIYFLYEGAGYHNTLGYCWTPAGSETQGLKSIIFPDASLRSGNTRTSWEPLKVGDFVEIGVGGNGYQLDFFLISNGVNGGQEWMWNDPSRNSDGLQHMVAFMIPDSRFILLGFEDLLYGGDLDYNDCLFVVDIGADNAQNLLDEPGTLPH